MGQYTFTVEAKGNVCLSGGIGTYNILRKTESGAYMRMTINNINLSVGSSNRCVELSIPGDYLIQWPSDDCCSSPDPVFEYVESIQSQSNLSNLIEINC